jgi:hypothetical protein
VGNLVQAGGVATHAYVALVEIDGEIEVRERDLGEWRAARVWCVEVDTIADH